MKVLTVIANFGTKNDDYLRRLIAEYESMLHEVKVVVLSNIEKSFGASVEVVVKPPVGDPWTFPFAHKHLLAIRQDDYDLFIYSEDDTLLTGRNIDAFLAATQVLEQDEIAGFLRTEQGADGGLYVSTVHSHYHWDPKSVVARGDKLFAFFTNEHAAAYVLTRNQLKRAIASGGFLVEPHEGKYDLLVTAATDPYTQCGFRKLICISEVRHFLLPHLANRYVGTMGLSEANFSRQIAALHSIHAGTLSAASLLPHREEPDELRLAKSYYEPCRPDIVSLIPSGTKALLSYGCGWGATEAEFASRGVEVTAVPLDAVIGRCAERNDIKMVYGDSEAVMLALSGRQFDAILICNLLHQIPEPALILTRLGRLLAPEGILVATVPNLSRTRWLWRRLRGVRARLGKKEASGTQSSSYRKWRGWFKTSRFRIAGIVPCLPDRTKLMYRVTAKLTAGWLASEFLVVARKRPSLRARQMWRGRNEQGQAKILPRLTSLLGMNQQVKPIPD